MSTTAATWAIPTTTTAEMKRTSTVAALSTALVSTTAAAHGVIQCAALQPQVTDQWCTNNCNHVTPFCPPQSCKCSGATTTVDSRSTTVQDATTSVVDTTATPRSTTTAMSLSTTITSLSSTADQDSPTTTGEGIAKCRALTSVATDKWCTDNCNHSTPFCPPLLCHCGSDSARNLRGR